MDHGGRNHNYFIIIQKYYNVNFYSVLPLWSIKFVSLLNIMISAGQRLIVINRIQKKGFCLYNIYVCTVHIYYV